MQRKLGQTFTHFTEEARSVVTRSEEEAAGFGARKVESEHLLLALAAPEVGASARALSAAGADHATLRALIAAFAVTPSRSRSHGPFSKDSKKALELALREALSLDDDRVGTEHLLRGVLRGDRGRLAKLLGKRDIALDDVRARLVAGRPIRADRGGGRSRVV